MAAKHPAPNSAIQIPPATPGMSMLSTLTPIIQ
jgi:hypothetical protein